ncbi:hypothetical protein DPMN_109184 [Dreissena polymorpha]|uniref:Uncharacterized protein n=1 Tax=Dreissena polymorpha TaxID=45954 RepID=A0A9D4KA64_DREPO|nr:hypothetical protein DPMN_109184 [Dreissena polymorpha]
MHEKTNIVADNSARLSLTINRGKNKASRTNAYNNTPITVQGEALEEVDSFTYLGKILDIQTMQMSEPASVKHEQPSISCRASGDSSKLASLPRLSSSIPS